MGRVGISRLCRAGFMTDESSRPYRIEDLIRVRLRDLKTAACGIEVVYHARIAEEGGCYGRRHRHHDDPPASPCVRGCKPTGRIRDKQHLGSDQGKGAARPARSRFRGAAKIGFDWPSLSPVLAKAEEKICQLKSVLSDDKREAGAAHKVAEEFGDLLFVMANVACHLRIDPEAALRDANAKFVRRFHSIEAAIRAEGRTPEAATLEEMEQFWDEAKAAQVGTKD
jgi:NTP pyrophosphatase (non-canonical NTP hydrolase)